MVHFVYINKALLVFPSPSYSGLITYHNLVALRGYNFPDTGITVIVVRWKVRAGNDTCLIC